MQNWFGSVKRFLDKFVNVKKMKKKYGTLIDTYDIRDELTIWYYFYGIQVIT